jgi:hypothetical protein
MQEQAQTQTQSAPAPSVAAVVTKADLDAMEARLKAHVDQRLDELFSKLLMTAQMFKSQQT